MFFVLPVLREEDVRSAVTADIRRRSVGSWLRTTPARRHARPVVTCSSSRRPSTVDGMTECRKTRDASDDDTKERSLRAAISTSRSFIYRSWSWENPSVPFAKKTTLNQRLLRIESQTHPRCVQTHLFDFFPIAKSFFQESANRGTDKYLINSI